MANGIKFNNGANIRKVADFAEAVLIQPVDGEVIYIQSADGRGNNWRAVTGGNPGDYTSNGNPACGTTIIPTGGNGSIAWVRDYDGAVNVKWFGATGAGVVDEHTAFAAADTAAKLAGVTLTGQGTFLLSTQWLPTANSIDFGDALIQMDAAFASSECIVISGYSNEKLTINLTVNGDKANQTGNGVGVALRSVSTPHSDIRINAVDCKVGVLADGNAERLNVKVGGQGCDLLVDQKLNSSTPDEMNWWISGGLCDVWFQQDDSTSARVIFNVENNAGSTEFAVKILGAKYTSLGGIIRGSVAGGVYVNDTAQVAVVNFNNLCIYGTTGAYALYCFDGRMITGDLNIVVAAAGGAWISYLAGGGSLRLNVEGLTGGNGLKLGDVGVKDFRFGNIVYSAYGNAGSDFGVNIDSVSGHLTLDMTASDHSLRTNNISGAATISCGTRLISGNVEISINDETPMINFKGGGITSTQLAAYSYSAVGMSVDSTNDVDGFISPFMPSYYNGGNWTNAIITYTATTPTLATNGTLYLDTTSNIITATLPSANVVGQRLIIYMSNASNGATVSVTKHELGTPKVYTFSALYDKITLEWVGARWRTVYVDGPI